MNILRLAAIAVGAAAGVASSFLGLDVATAAMVGVGTTGAVSVAGRVLSGQKPTHDLALVAGTAAGVAAAVKLANDPTEAVLLTLSGPGAAVLFSAAANLGHDGAKTTHEVAKEGADLAAAGKKKLRNYV